MQTVVVTGGTAGIGLATVQALAARGYGVAVIARNPTRLAQVSADLAEKGIPALAISADVAEAAAVDDATDRIERDLGPIAAWVNNAMSTVLAPADEITAEEYARVTATTYLGQVHGTLAALRHMKPRGAGAIIQISSALGFRGVPMQAAYCAAKFAVSGFTDALRAELIADGIDISLTTVYLPAVNTPQFGWARNRTGRRQLAPDPVYDPRLCARAIVQAIERPTREVWVGRNVAMMAAGQALTPGYADRRASDFKDAQLGEPEQPRAGNLFEPVPGPAAIDGPWSDRVDDRKDILTSRHRNAATMAAAGIIAGLSTMALSRLLVGLKGRRR